MTVKELIDGLKEYPQELQVKMQDTSVLNFSVTDVEVRQLEAYDKYQKIADFVYLTPKSKIQEIKQ